jgi:type VI secretion system protein ImpG
MDPRLLQYYNSELQHLREMGAEFSREFPRIAGRLGIDGIDVQDPYVERLLEGFAFLAARVQLKLDAEFPIFTQHLLEMVYPHYLAPTPSMAVVRFEPKLTEGALARGVKVERGSVLRTQAGKGETTRCDYRTAHEVSLWPIELTEIEYITSAMDVPGIQGIKASLRLRLKATAGLRFNAIDLDRLPLFLHAPEGLGWVLYEQLVGNALGVVVQPVGPRPEWREVSGPDAVGRHGFDEDQALLPPGPRSFSGHRLIHEYFAFPERFAFVELRDLARGLRRCPDDEIDIFVLLDRGVTRLEHALAPHHLHLFCTPIINLFPKRTDRVAIRDRDTESHVVADRTRPMDFEIYQVLSVVGFGTSESEKQLFRPFYGSKDVSRHSEPPAFFTVQRRPRMLSSKQRLKGTRTSYVGHEAYVSLVDASEAPYRANLRELEVEALCTNRDLPLTLSFGGGRTDFGLVAGAPVKAVRCVAGPTAPVQSLARGDIAWRLIGHLSLNYLSLLDTDERKGAEALRELLGLYGNVALPEIRRQIDGVRSVESSPVVRRLPLSGPLTFGRGLKIQLTLDESAFEGTGVFLLGAVLEDFFRRYVSINSFTETTVRTPDRGEIMKWPVRLGRRHVL